MSEASLQKITLPVPQSLGHVESRTFEEIAVHFPPSRHLDLTFDAHGGLQDAHFERDSTKLALLATLLGPIATQVCQQRSDLHIKQSECLSMLLWHEMLPPGLAQFGNAQEWHTDGNLLVAASALTTPCAIGELSLPASVPRDENFSEIVASILNQSDELPDNTVSWQPDPGEIIELLPDIKTRSGTAEVGTMHRSLPNPGPNPLSRIFISMEFV